MKRIVLIILIVTSILSLYSQEVLVNIGNPFLQKYSSEYLKQNSLKATMTVDTLELPFFDDFANSFVYPDSTKWLDKFAFINNDYAIDPISYGVATLDAINQYGAVYTHLPSMSSGIADYMTSCPIKLNVDAVDSVYLSFYYQAGGTGNDPEDRDSLVLQFKSPDTDWESVWRVEGGSSDSSFNLVLLSIVEDKWLTSAFQFRFLNYASISTNYEPSWRSNTDHWNIDYIKIDTARYYADTLAKDVAIISNSKSLIVGFESVPWGHYKEASVDMMADTIRYLYKSSYGPGDTININRQYHITDMYGTNSGYLWDDDSENILPLETMEFAREMNYTFNSDSEDSAKFMIKSYIKTDLTEDRYIYRWNDTVRYYQNFANYYAYDDGTAEKGYGITGQNTAYSSLAYQFTPLVADSLYGAYIYFNQVLDEANRKYFFFTVWGDNEGIPGDTLVQVVGAKPSYSDEVNGFIYYSLETAVYIDTTFYIGWTKTTDDMLNCGFDLNRKANQHLFFNVTGQWQPSQMEGALMIRPVFGKNPDISFVSPITTFLDFDIYPNPTKDVLHISAMTEFSFVDIYDASGKLVLSLSAYSEMDVSALQNGIYFVKLRSDFDIYRTQKLIIVR
ncbi:MAG: T9SS type A sorting domain-containing protein [Bacteroidales bacterium]|nr:T9SS type A sorting domain-containing protein [Bacteroidales bacterium]